tara:strand:- start:4809 stop:6170 length:1362 start_codon:yes stop_codon:yes gene_type:complete
MSKWNLESWKQLSIEQSPGWERDDKLTKVLQSLMTKPPIVFKNEIILLKKRLKQAYNGKYFILQGGDCAETFSDFNTELIKNKLNILLQMSVVLSYATSIKTLRIGRIAGQFAKPRTHLVEQQNKEKYPSYRGDAVNGIEFSKESRSPDPKRMIRMYDQSSYTLNLIRSMINEGYTNIHNANQWDLEFIKSSKQGKQYREVIKKIQQALSFMKTMDLVNNHNHQLELYEFFTSHEGLLLEYEQALTRFDPRDKKYYNYSGHMIWVGDRTRDLDGAHIEFVSGIENPIGIKIGPNIIPDQLIKILKKVNPNNEEGKILLISRLGADKINDILPELIKKINENQLKVIWLCDPMHGNTFKNKYGYKTRHFNTILNELEQYMAIHKSLNTNPGGIHIEFTSEDVTECLGGFQNINNDTLLQRYETACDPRLNNLQSLELIFKLTNLINPKEYECQN